MMNVPRLPDIPQLAKQIAMLACLEVNNLAPSIAGRDAREEK
jgi:hypothetical protein